MLSSVSYVVELCCCAFCLLTFPGFNMFIVKTTSKWISRYEEFHLCHKCGRLRYTSIRLMEYYIYMVGPKSNNKWGDISRLWVGIGSKQPQGRTIYFRPFIGVKEVTIVTIIGAHLVPFDWIFTDTQPHPTNRYNMGSQCLFWQESSLVNHESPKTMLWERFKNMPCPFIHSSTIHSYFWCSCLPWKVWNLP